MSGRAGPAPRATASPTVDWPAIHLVDSDLSPGAIVSVDPDTGAVIGAYTRASGTIATIGMNEYPNKIYFTSGSGDRLYRVMSSGGRWQEEQVFYEHDAPIVDIEQVMRPGLPHDVYFSEPAIGASAGKIYQLVLDQLRLHYEVDPADVGGRWDGHFTFDDEMNIYLSTGGATPGRVYKVVDGTPRSVFRTQTAPVAGLTWVRGAEDEGALYYVNLASRLSRLDLAHGYRSLLYTTLTSGRLADVDTQGIEGPVPTLTPSSTPRVTATPTPTSRASVTATVTPSKTPVVTTLTVTAETGLGAALEGLRIALTLDRQQVIVETPYTGQLPRTAELILAAPTQAGRGPVTLHFMHWRLHDGSIHTGNRLEIVLSQEVMGATAVYGRGTPGPGTVTPTATATDAPSPTATPTVEATTSASTPTATATEPPSETPTSEPTSEPTDVPVYLPLAVRDWMLDW